MEGGREGGRGEMVRVDMRKSIVKALYQGTSEMKTCSSVPNATLILCT